MNKVVEVVVYRAPIDSEVYTEIGRIPASEVRAGYKFLDNKTEENMPKVKRRSAALDFVCYYLTCGDWEVHTEDIEEFKTKLFKLYPDLKREVQAYLKENPDLQDRGEDDDDQ